MEESLVFEWDVSAANAFATQVADLMKTVAVSILSFNSSEQTIDCVKQLLTVSDSDRASSNIQLYIADNGSNVEEQQVLKHSLKNMPSVHYTQHMQNAGFAAGHNSNIELILQHSEPDFIWLLNNDCLVHADTIPALLQCAENRPDVGIWGATILEPDGKTIQCAGGCFYSSWLTTFRQFAQGKPKAELGRLTEQQFDYISGASLFFPTSALLNGLRPAKGSKQSLPWLNETFFLYFEELDLAKRLKPEYKMAWCKSAIITHIGGSSTGTTGQNRSESAEYHSSLSALKFIQIYYPGRLWLVAPIRYVLKCIQLGFSGKLGLMAPLTRAYRDFWSAKPIKDA